MKLTSLSRRHQAGFLSIQHLLILLVIVVLIFGTKKLRNTGGDLGAAIRNFKEGMKGEAAPEAKKDDAPNIIEHDDKA